MNANRFLGALLAAGLGLSAITFAPDVDAQRRGKAKNEEPAPTEPPMAKKPFVIQPKAFLPWGQSIKQVSLVYDALLDEDFKPQFKKASPGVAMKRLEAQLAEEKSKIRRSRIDFGKLPTTVDATPLKGEYTYMNKESMLTVTRQGVTRRIFFIQDKHWKYVDEFNLGEGAEWGEDFAAAVTKLAASFGVPGRIVPPDPAKGRYFTEVDWKDGTNHIRAVQRSETSFALILSDLATEAILPSLRPNKPPTNDAIDPAVAAAIGGSSEPPPPEDPKSNTRGKR